MKLSALMQVYNEELCLPCSLPAVVAVADEVVIIDGGPDGPSTDGTKAIIDQIAGLTPGKIIYLSGTYLKEDGSWDEPAQVNYGLSKVTGDYLMRITADIVFDNEDLLALREAIERFPDKKYFYCRCIDFAIDTTHFLLQHTIAVEGQLPREICGPDAGIVVAMSANPRAIEQGEYGKFGMVADIDYGHDILYLPHVTKYHYGLVKPFASQVIKYYKSVMKGDFEEFGGELAEQGDQAIIAEAINWVRNLPDTLPRQPYTGRYPVNGEPLLHMNIMQGYEEFMEDYSVCFLGDHAVPNKPDYPEEPPTSEEIANDEQEIVDLLPAIDGSVAGMARHEKFIAEIIAHHYSDANLIDLGCGNAKFLACLLRDGYIGHGTAVDAVAGVLENARQTLASIDREVPLIASTIEDLELETRYDVVLCLETLEHMYNANTGVQKARSLMQPMGMFAGTVPLGNTCDCERHKHYFTKESLSKLLNRFFYDVTVSIMDFTGDGELHLLFSCRDPK